MLATSSAKLSTLFSRPSPLSILTKFTSLTSLISCLLVIALILSAFSFVGCDIQIDNGETGTKSEHKISATNTNNRGTSARSEQQASTSDVNEEKPELHQHSDRNDDGSCDTCYESVIVILDFYAVNDLHGKFCDSDTQPGVDNLATYLKTRNDYYDNVIIFSSGDMWKGAA